jgi:hypothetical protein
MRKPAVVLVAARCLLLPAVGLLGCGDLVTSTPDAGSMAASSRDAGKRDAGTKRDASTPDAGRDDTANEGSSGDASAGEDPSADTPSDAGAPDMGDDNQEEMPAIEVITTDTGTKIYVDPSCEGTSAMMSGMWLEFVGCCLESGTCGVSNHKIMLPPVIAAMFPVQCSGYEMLAGLGAEIPATKSCTIPD